MQVVRFFHLRGGQTHEGGATVRVVGNTENVGSVDVQVSYCHPISKKLLGRKRHKRGPDYVKPVVRPEVIPPRKKGEPKQFDGDFFNKKVGRERAESAPIERVPLRYLPRKLDEISKVVGQHMRSKAKCEKEDYTFAIRYFLPKE